MYGPYASTITPTTTATTAAAATLAAPLSDSKSGIGGRAVTLTSDIGGITTVKNGMSSPVTGAIAFTSSSGNSAVVVDTSGIGGGGMLNGVGGNGGGFGLGGGFGGDGAGGGGG